MLLSDIILLYIETNKMLNFSDFIWTISTPVYVAANRPVLHCRYIWVIVEGEGGGVFVALALIRPP